MDDRPALRRATNEDAPDLAELWIEFGRYYADLDPVQYREPKRDGLVGWFRRQLDEQVGEDQAWLVAQGQDRLVGSIHGEIWRPTENAEWELIRDLGETALKINHLIVTEAERRKGIGHALMQAVEAWGRGRGATRAFLISAADSPSSVPFYEVGMGYRRKTIGFWKSLR
jgi:GNAT superfamily N-acetyltransferase